jgi:anaerobic magnesium-protoporphyrin IX monomethyl ester cyclase
MITLVNCVAPHSAKGSGIPPPGLLSLAAAVRGEGIAIRIADLAITGSAALPPPEVFPSWLGEIPPLVGFSTMSNMLPYALEAARCLKSASPATTILFGGCGASAAPEEILRQFSFVDFVLQGEAERTLPKFLQEYPHAGPWWRTEGLAYREQGRILVNAAPPRITDLDSLPLPAYDLVPRSAFQGYVGLLTSRGCPFQCTYCEGGVVRGERLAAHSLARVLAEIRGLQNDYQVSRFQLLDDTFTVNRDRVIEFCQSYNDGGCTFDWGALSRVDGLDLDLMERMAQARCGTMYFGVESGSDRVLEMIRKRVTSDRIAAVVPRAREYFPKVVASFMWGFPFESLEDLEATLLLAAYLRSAGVMIQLHLWAPMPRSSLCKQYQAQLVYDPEVQSDFVAADVDRYAPLIASNSRLFAPFYHVPHPAMAEKRAMIDAMGFSE